MRIIDRMTITKEPLEEYEGRLKCDRCNHFQHKHRFGKDICLTTNCYCDRFISPVGGLKWLSKLNVPTTRLKQVMDIEY